MRLTDSRLPTHTELTTFLSAFFPDQSSNNDVSFLYHTPRHPSYDPARALASRIVLSVTPTAGVYSALNRPGTRHAPMCFLHRPWKLDRRSVRRGSLVLACHRSFDAHLTVGWNTALAERLGVDVEEAVCIQGYKGDPLRKIGLVAMLSKVESVTELRDRIRAEFDGVGDLFTNAAPTDSEVDTGVRVLAIMNAFHADEIARVLSAAREKGWASSPDEGRHTLYLTGAARPYGLEATAKINMPAVCVGHRACEEWGIRYLADQIQSKWPNLEVIKVFEEEEVDNTQLQPGEREEPATNPKTVERE